MPLVYRALAAAASVLEWTSDASRQQAYMMDAEYLLLQIVNLIRETAFAFSGKVSQAVA